MLEEVLLGMDLEPGLLQGICAEVSVTGWWSDTGDGYKLIHLSALIGPLEERGR